MTPRVDDGAWVAGGILAASGDLRLGLTVEDAIERLATALRPPGRSVPWAPPVASMVARLADTLSRAWTAAAAAADAAAAPDGWDQSVLRLRVDDLDALASLGGVSPGGASVAAHAGFDARGFAWRWPVCVGVLSEHLVKQVLGQHLLIRVLDPGGDAGRCEFLVLDRPAGQGQGVPVGVRVACVVLTGTSARDLNATLLDRLRDAGVAAVIASPTPDVSWLPTAIRHLACGRPLDVAVALADPDAVLLASDAFLELTSAREYARQLVLSLRGAKPPVLPETLAALERLADTPFDADGRAGAALAALVRTLPEDATTITSDLTSGAPPADDPVDDDGPVARDLPFDLDGDSDDTTTPVPPDDRRLQAKVVDPATDEVLERFVGGAVNDVKVRIASAVSKGVVIGDAPFVSPTPGRDVDLTVEVIAEGTHARRKLTLPATGDSGWTRAVPVEVPANVTEFTVFVQIWFGGRVVQSAGLFGPVVTGDGPPPAGTFRLSVDASTPPGAVGRMSPAGASITIVPGLTGEPVALTFAQGPPIEGGRLAKANKGARAVLLQAFTRPAPKDLAGAAGPLTALAIRGRILHDSLRETMEGFPGDDVRWIHVSSLGSADLPLELVYTHPKPALDDEVPVCPTAIAGAEECVATCPDRERADVVCPYGFWATSKVIERRHHVDRRAKAQAGSERRIAVLTAGAAGVAVKADEVDTGASARILDAVKAAVTVGRFRAVSTWKEVGDAAKAPPTILVLITHTIPDDDLGPNLQLGSDLLRAHRVADGNFLNPGVLEPGPVVIAIGCDTAGLDTSFGDYVTNLHAGGAELVVSAISPVPGKQVADFVERFFAALPDYLATPGVHRFGAVLTAVRRQTVATGDVLGLAITASGDADVALQGV